MNIIKKIARVFGFDIIRFSKPKTTLSTKISNTNKVSNKEVISGEFAKEVLESVGRKSNISSFTYFNRPDKSSEKMELAENLWWNENGKIIEKVWVLSDDLNSRYRSAYVSKAADFFKTHKGEARILDLGCGSGWFGRMIANEHMNYVGMDFSSTQIEIANQKKEGLKNEKYLNYYCVSDIENIPNLEQTTGVVIHAFLHHLYWEDLRALFNKLHLILPEGCKFFIMEPIYPDLINQTNPDIIKKKLLAVELLSAFRKYLAEKKSVIISSGFYDINTETELSEMFKESSRNSFFFSPKEVPFRMTEFKEFLRNYIIINNYYYCGITNLETAQFIDRVENSVLKKDLVNTLMPLSESIDTLLLSEGYVGLNPNEYLFTCFEGILKKK